MEAKVRVIDCVGFMVDGAAGPCGERRGASGENAVV
ncbi:MAG: hypothetical protein ACLR0U_20625 [Enterocloster clostridioformis]